MTRTSSTNQPIITVGFSLPAAGVSLTKVVLMAPGAVTHHFDPNQRYVECVTVQSFAGLIRFRPPMAMGDQSLPYNSHAPKGYYMLFLVTNENLPSQEAKWVQLVDTP